MIHRLKEPKTIFSKVPHTLIAGGSGTGKGMQGEFYVPQFALDGEKVFDMNSEDRGEGMYYSLPQTNPALIRSIKYLSNGILKPRTYENEIIMFLSHRLKKLKKLPKNIKVCVFREDWLENDDLKNFLAFNDNQADFMDAVFELHGDVKMNLHYLYKFLQAAGKSKESRESKAIRATGVHFASVNVIKKRTRALLRSGLFYNNEDDLNKYFYYLNLEESLQQRKVITTFSTYLITNEYMRFICINMLLKKFIELLESRKHFIPIVFYFREGNDFFYQDKPQPYIMGIRDSIEMLLRKGRSLGGSKITMVMDTQYIKDLPDSVFYGFAKHFLFRLPVKDSKKMQNKATIPELYLHKLSEAKVGMCMYIASGVFEYPYRCLPTLHAKADPKIDVFLYLAKEFGEIDYSKSSFLELDLLPPEKPQFEVEA